MNALPSYLQQYQAPDVGAALSQNLGSSMPPHVSIEGGRFTLIDAGNNEIPVPTFDPQIGVYLDACIIDVNNVMSRQYYKDAYTPTGQGKPPDCWSDNGIGPSINAGLPQARTCQPDPDGVFGCKMAVWGSRINPNGKGVPACTQKQKVALLIPGFPTLFLLAIPPNSHSFLRDYVEKCRGNQINMANVITRISFVPGVQGTLQFHGQKYIDEAIAQLRQAAYAEKKTDALVGRNDVPRSAGAMAQISVGPDTKVVTYQEPTPYTTSPQVATVGDANRPMPAQQQVFQQVQQPAPFTAPAAPQTNTAGPAVETQQPAGAAQSNGPTSPPQRRRRRTSAEVQAANVGQPSGQQAAAAPQAPFPHAGQATTQPSQADMGFGMSNGQPAGANPEVAAALDSFFQT